MNSSDIIYTNIFCLLGNPGSGRATLLKSVLEDTGFTEDNKITRLTYGTTRAITPHDVIGQSYFFYTEEEYMNLDPNSILESRSYDLITSGKVNYYFTLKDHIKFGNNYIGKISLFQYEDFKKWAEMTQLKYPMMQISVYPIMINCNSFERFDRLKNKATTEDELYDLCARLVSEKYESDTVRASSPEVNDKSNHNTLVLDNNTKDISNIDNLSAEIKQFIHTKLSMQGV